jgi:MFS family permease
LLDFGVWRLALVLFLIVTSGYGFSFFLPQIVKRLSGASDLAVGLWTAIPFSVAAVGMFVIAAHSDRTGERRRVVAGCAALAAAGLAASSLTDAPLLALGALAIGAIGLYSATPPFWSLPTAFLRGDGAAAGIGLINSVGNLGGFVGPYVMGFMQNRSGDFRLGLRMLAVSAVCSGLLVLTVRVRSAESLALQRP